MTKNGLDVNNLDQVIDSNITESSLLLGEYLSDLNTDLLDTSSYNWLRHFQRDRKQDSDLIAPAALNVTKSVVDTLVSKMTTKRPFPFVRSINGLQDTEQVAEAIQSFINILYDYKHVERLFIDAFADACIFGTGYVYVDPVTYEISNLKPFELGLYTSELKYGTPKRMLIKRRAFPVALLEQYGIKNVKGDSEGNVQYFHHYIDINKQEQELFVNGRSVKVLPYKSDKLPIIPVYYNKPCFGSKTVSVVQELEGIQNQIDECAAKASACNQAWSGNTTFIMASSNIKPVDIDNHGNKVFTIADKYNQSSGTPFANVSSPVMDPSVQPWIEFLKRQAFDMIGVSQMSAEARVDPNVESGVMYRSVIDNESDRLSRATKHFVDAHTDLINLLVELLPEDADVVPQTLNTSSVKWRDVKKQRDLFKISFAVVEQKSRDISEQAKYVNALLNQGLIQLNEVGYYLNRPDMESAIGHISALYGGIKQCITRAIKYADYEIPDFVDPEALEIAIAKEENILYSQVTDDKDKNEIVEESLARLMILEEMNLRRVQEMGLLQQPTEEAATEDEVNNGEAQNLEEANPVIEDDSSTKQDDMVNPEGDF